MNKMRNVSDVGNNLIDMFISFLEDKNLSERTLQEYSSDLKHFIGWHEYQCMESCENVLIFSFSQINKEELKTYINAMINIDLKPSTINRRISTLKLFFDWAYHNGHSKRNPAKHIKLIKLEKNNPRVITDDEEKSLLEAVKAHGTTRDQVIIVLMIHAGLRVGETCNIKKSDIYLSDKNCYIKISTNNLKHKIPLNIPCQKLLEKYLRSVKNTSEYLLVSAKTNDKLTERALRHIVKKYMDLAGLEGLSAYSFRYNYAYRKANNIPVEKHYKHYF